MKPNEVYIQQESKVPPSICIGCGSKHDGATGVRTNSTERVEPTPGSLTICTSCGEVMCFDENLRLRALTGPEKYEFLVSPDFVFFRRVSAFFRDRKRRRGLTDPRIN